MSKIKLIQILVKDNQISYCCQICQNPGEWQGKPLKLKMEWADDSQTEIGRLLCPNCYSQSRGSPDEFCKDCGKPRDPRSKSKLCRDCNSIKRRKVDRPSKRTLENDLNTMSFRAVGRKYNVSDNTIRKWCKNYRIKI
jgi:hypothetical protein